MISHVSYLVSYNHFIIIININTNAYVIFTKCVTNADLPQM